MKKLIILMLLFCTLVFTLPAQVYAYENKLDLTESSIITPIKQIELDSGGGGGSSYTMIQSTSTSKNSLGALTKNTTYTSKKFRQGLIENYYTYKVTGITEHNGVYSNLFGTYYSKALLESGSVTNTMIQNRTYEETVSESFNFSMAVGFELEAGLYYSAELAAGLTGTMSAKSTVNISYSYAYTYSRVEKVSRSTSTTYVVNDLTAQYCPTGYSISIGKVGEFTVLTLEVKQYEIWWWGTYEVASNYVNVVYVDEGNLTETFIYKVPSTQQTYYLI